jgi:putative tryptophan/tyrosine transport system substrate-binding protein
MKLAGATLGTSVGFILLAAALTAEAQQAKVSRLGFLGISPASAYASRIAGLRHGLRELGYVEGKNITIEWRYADSKAERLPDLAMELVRLPVDVIIAAGVEPTHAAKQVTTTIPIVMGQSGDPVAAGLVASLARPGGNITGLTLLAAELNGKRLGLLAEAAPGTSRVALLTRPVVLYGPMRQEVEAAARVLMTQLQVVEARDPGEFEGAFRAIARGHAQALMTLPDPMIWTHRTRIAELALKGRLPTMFPEREFVDAGGLMSYGPSLPDLWRRAATHVDKILKGSKPGDLPIEQPTTFELVINLKTAKALGLTIPPSVLRQATEVVE